MIDGALTLMSNTAALKPTKWMLHCHFFPTLWRVLLRKYKICLVAETDFDLLFFKKKIK